MTRAVFLDRDGTLVHDPGYLADPNAVHLLPGVSDALRRLEEAGWLRIVVTNQSGIGRGRITPEDFRAVEHRIAELLAADGASVTATYHCPHRPEAGCSCRKPGSALHRLAVAEHGIVLGESWWVGDRVSDILTSREFGGSGVLLLTGEGERHAHEARAEGFPVVADLAEAAAMILGSES